MSKVPAVAAVGVAVTFAATISGVLLAQDRTTREQISAAVSDIPISRHCVACHGPSGITPNPTFPHLAGQNGSYLAAQLKKFKSGERYDPLMTPIAQSLSPEEISDLARFYSRIGPLAGAPLVGDAR